MANLPEKLLGRLGVDEGRALARAVDVVGEELFVNYKANAADHQEARGDTARLFGMKIYEHQYFRLERRFEDDPVIQVVSANGSYSLKTGPLSVGVYKVGSLAEEDIHYRFPEGSPTKRSYGERNRDQLSLFETEAHGPMTLDAAFALNDLTIAHLGNPSEKLVKWYVGAFVVDSQGLLRWAWVQRQEIDGLAIQPSSGRKPIVPFDQRPAADLDVKPRDVPKPDHGTASSSE